MEKIFYDEFDSSMANQLLAQLEKLDIFKAAETVISLSEYWEKHHKKVYVQGVDGAPDWLRYEDQIWSLGDTLRILLKKKKKWRGKTQLLDSIESIASNKIYGKGRQTLVLLLGEYGGSCHIDSLANLLSDNEVYGHAIDALNKIKAYSFVDKVKKIYEVENGWIKSEAKKYILNANTNNRNNRGQTTV